MKQIYLLLLLFFFIASCNQKNEPTTKHVNISAPEKKSIPTEDKTIDHFKANAVTEIGKNVRSILQDKDDNYWFGTDNGGVYRYNNHLTDSTGHQSLLLFTKEDGLFQNQIQTIQEDQSGNIFFGTGGFGVNRFDGITFTTLTGNENPELNTSLFNEWKTEPGDLWFYAGAGAYRCYNNSFTYLPFPTTKVIPANAQNNLSAYAVYCSLKDREGNIWFGTQTMGVCRYGSSASIASNTKTFTWFNEKGLGGPAVRAIFEDKNGNLWFGNNGNGLFKYDGVKLTNFTEEHGLGNPEFFKTGESGPATLARVWTINEDDKGNLWIGTVDAGVWRYDGKNLKQYTTKDGLTSPCINVIYKDKKGELWFGTEGDLFKFNGKSFTKFVVE